MSIYDLGPNHEDLEQVLQRVAQAEKLARSLPKPHSERALKAIKDKKLNKYLEQDAEQALLERTKTFASRIGPHSQRIGSAINRIYPSFSFDIAEVKSGLKGAQQVINAIFVRFMQEYSDIADTLNQAQRKELVHFLGFMISFEITIQSLKELALTVDSADWKPPKR